MRNFTKKTKTILLVASLMIIGLLTSAGTFAQTSAGAGDWNSTTSNSPWPSGTLPASNATVTINTAVTINAAVVNTGFAITIASGGSLTFGSSGSLSAATITISSGGSLVTTSGGSLTITGNTFSNLNVNQVLTGATNYTFSGSALTISPISTSGNVTISGGTTTCANVTAPVTSLVLIACKNLNVNAGATLNYETSSTTANSTITVTGDFVIAGNFYCTSNGSNVIVNLNGTAASSNNFSVVGGINTDFKKVANFNIKGPYTVSANTLLTNTRAGTGAMALTSVGYLTIPSPYTFDPQGYIITVASTSSLVVQSGASINVSAANATPIPTSSASSPLVSYAGTVVYNVNPNNVAAQSVVAASYNNLTITGARAATAVTLGATINITGNFVNNATFTSGSIVNTGSTVTFNGTGAATQSISGTATTTPFNILTVGNGTTQNPTLTVNSPISTAASTGILTVNSGSTLVLGAALTNNYTTTISGTLQMNASGSIVNAPTYSGSTSTLVYNTGMTTSNEWNGAGPGVGSGVPGNVTIQAATVSLAGARAISGNLSITSTGALDVSVTNYGLTVGNFANSGGTFTPRNGTVTINSGASQTISGATTFYNLTISTTSTNVIASGATTVSNLLTVSANTTLQLGASLTLSNGTNGSSIAGTLQLNSGGSIATNAAIYSGTGSLTYNEGSAVNTGLEWNGNSITVGAGQPYNVTLSTSNTQLTIGGARSLPTAGTVLVNLNTTLILGSGTFTNPTNTSILGTLQINSGNLTNAPVYGAASSLIYNSGNTNSVSNEWTAGSTSGAGVPNNVQINGSGSGLSLGNYTYYMTGNFSNSGTFTANSSTLNLNGANQTISGSNTFYNLTKSVAAAATLTLTAGTNQIVSNTLSLNGAAGNFLTITSSSASAASINPSIPSNTVLNYCNVLYITNSNSTAISSNNSTDGGHNVNLLFPVNPPTNYTWVGGTSTSWTTTSNWNPSTGYPGQNQGDTASINISSNGSTTYNATISSVSINIARLLVGTTGSDNTTSNQGKLAISSGSLTVSGSGVTTLGAVVLSGGSITNYGTVSISGSQQINGIQFTNPSNTNFSSSYTDYNGNTPSGTTTINCNTAVSSGGGFCVYLATTFGTPTFTPNAPSNSLTPYSTNPIFGVTNGGIAYIGGTITTTSTLFSSSNSGLNITINSGANLSSSGNLVILSGTNSIFTINSGATLTYTGSSTGNPIYVSSPVTATALQSTTLTNNGTINLQSGSGFGGGAGIRLYGNTPGTTVLNNNGIINVFGTITSTSFGSITTSNTGDITINNGSASNTNTQNVNSQITLTIPSGNIVASPAFYNICSGTVTINNYGSFSASDAVSASFYNNNATGTLIINNYATTVTGMGTLTLSSSATNCFNNTSSGTIGITNYGTLSMSSTSASANAVWYNGSLTSGNLTFTNNGVATLSSSKGAAFTNASTTSSPSLTVTIYNNDLLYLYGNTTSTFGATGGSQTINNSTSGGGYGVITSNGPLGGSSTTTINNYLGGQIILTHDANSGTGYTAISNINFNNYGDLFTPSNAGTYLSGIVTVTPQATGTFCAGGLSSNGIMNINPQSVTFADTLKIKVFGTTAGTNYDQINSSLSSNPTWDVTNATLDLTGIYTPSSPSAPFSLPINTVGTNGTITGPFKKIVGLGIGTSWSVGYTSRTAVLSFNYDPASFSSPSTTYNSVSLSATANSYSNNIMVLASTSPISFTPTPGTAPASQTLPSGVTNIYTGSTIGLSGYNLLSPSTVYYFKAYSFDGISNIFSPGVSISATTATPLAPIPTFNSSLTATGSYGTSFSYLLASVTQNNPTSYTATGLPAGLSIDAGTGIISGSPTTTGTFTVSLSATNESGTGNGSLSLTVSGYLYYSGSGALNSYLNWYTSPSGAGTQAYAATAFTQGHTTFEISTNATTSAGSWTVSGTGSSIVLGNVSKAAVTLTIASGSPISGSIAIVVPSSGTTNTLNLQDATIPTFGTLDASSTVIYAASVAQTVTPVTYGNLTIANTYIGNGINNGASASTAFTVTNSLTVNQDTYLTLSANEAITVDGSIVINGHAYIWYNAYLAGTASFTASSTAVLTIGTATGITTGTGSGPIRTSGTRSLTAASYVFNAASGSQSTGNGFPSSVNNLTLSTGVSAIVSLSGNLTVTNTLTFTAGFLNLGANNLTVSSISGYGNSTYIIAISTGKLTIISVGSGTVVIPVGTSATSYTPLSLVGTTNSPNISVGVQGTFTHTPANSSNIVNLQWSVLSSTASNSTITLQYNTANVTGTLASPILGTYSSAYAESALGGIATVSTGVYSVTQSSAAALGTGSAYLYGIGNPYSFALLTPTISITNSPVIYNGASKAATVVGNSGGTVSNIKYNGSSTIPTNAGTYAINADIAANGNYSAQTGLSAGNFTINPATPTLNVTNSPVTYNGTPQAATVSGTGLGTVSNIRYNGSSTVPTNTGTYTITADIAASANYNAGTGLGAGSFTINATVPGVPTYDTAIADNAQVYVGYAAPVSNGGSAIIDYTITAIPTSGSPIVRTGVTTNPYTFDLLTNNKTYTFTVAARNSAGLGATRTTNAATPSKTTIWNGTTWSAGIPDATQIAVITGSYTNSTPMVCYNLIVRTGVTFTNNDSLTVTNSPDTINGTIKGTGTVVLAGTSAQIIAGAGTVGNLTLNNTAGATVSGTLGVTGVLNLQAGTLTTGGNVILKSTSIANSGILGLIAAGASISGNITVERYIPKGFRAFRDLSANGVFNTSNNLWNTWQESAVNHPGYGMFITGGTPDSAADDIKNGYNDANGIDRTLTGYSSAYYYANGWNTVTNTKTTALNPFQSFRVLIRGDRNFNLDTTPVVAIAGPTVLAMQDATTLRATGVPVTGDVTFRPSGITNAVTGATYNSSQFGLTTVDTGYTYLANPYACPIVFDSIYNNSSNIKAGYYYLDPTIGSTGAWVSYNALNGYSTNPKSDVALYGKYIQAGQGFLVGNNHSSSPVVVLKESFKATGSNVRTAVFGTTTPKSAIAVGLLKKGGNVSLKMDGAVAVFDNSFNNGLGLEDNTKFSNATDNLSISEGGHSYSIDGRLPATVNDKLVINLGQLSGTDYNFVIDASAYTGNGLSPYLVDANNKTATAINGIDTIAFTVNTGVAVTYQNRFSIVFKPTTLAVNSFVASAAINGTVATINWNTVGENGVASYEVEKSNDGTLFTGIAQQVAKNTATASYTATEKDVVATNNVMVSTITYYRIKAISTDGTITYSNTIKLNTNNSPLTTIYPNPLTGKTLNVQLGNVVAGKYVITIYNSLGQKVSEQAINHAGGNSTHTVNMESSMAKGIYNVVIRDVNSKEQVFLSTLSVN